MNPIYLDNAATQALLPEVAQEVLPVLTGAPLNASSTHAFGREAKRLLELARGRAANALGAQKDEIYFTSGGTEADNWAIKGVALKKGRGHIITSSIEHHAVLHSCMALEKQGFAVTYLPVDKDGLVDPAAVKNALRGDTVLVSVMAANNEIGTIEPICEIGQLCRDAGVPFHTDAVQAVGNMAFDLQAMPIDLLSLSGHKLGAPKGCGLLYVRKGVQLLGFMDGGAQERNLRAGTENLSAVVGLGKALEIAAHDLGAAVEAETRLRDRLIAGILSRIEGACLNGHPSLRLPGNVNVSIPGIEGQSLLILLDMEGVLASSGSACTAGSPDPSHVLLAIGRDETAARGSLRLTLSRQTTQEEVDRALDILCACVERLRAFTPFRQEKGGKELV